MSDVPSRCARSCAGWSPTARPQLDVPVQLNVNENPYPPLAGGGRRHRDARWREARGDAEPLPRPGVRRAAHGAGRLPRRHGGSGHAGAGVGGQRLQRGDAAAAAGLRRAGPDRAELRADVLDVSRVRPRHRHRVGRRPPRRRTSRSTSTARRDAGRGSSRPDVVLLPIAQQPDRHRAAARGGRRCCARPRGAEPADRRGRRGVRRVPPRRHAQRARAAAAAPQPGRHPHDEQGVRAGRRPARLPRRATRRSATRSASSGCPTTSRRSPRRPRWPRCAHAAELLGRVDDLRAERDATVALAARRRGSRSPTATPTSCCSGTFADRHAVWQGLLDRGVLVRETGPDGWLRVSIGTADEMAAFQARALAESRWKEEPA